MASLMRPMKLLLASCVLAFAMQCNAALGAPETGWWWNPDESGRGFFIESQGGIFYLAGYFYDTDGRPTWLVAGGPNADPNAYDGRLASYAGGQTLFGTYRAPTGPVDAGAVSVRFTDERHGTITWPGGTVPIQRHAFGGTDPAFAVLPGWWWNPEESGRGYSIELQGDILFIASFMYDDQGRPAWYLSAGPMTSPTHYEGLWRRYSNGQTMTGPYHAPDPPQTIGTLAIDFDQADKGTMTVTPVTSAVAGSADAINVAPIIWKIVREFRPWYELLDDLEVRFTYDASYISAGSDIRYKISGLVAFVKNEVGGEEVPPLAPKLEASAAYTPLINAKAKVISIEYTGRTTSGFDCDWTGGDSVEVPAGAGLYLEISHYGPLVGSLNIPKIPFKVKGHCSVGGFPFDVQDEDDGLIVTIPLKGSILKATGRDQKQIGQGALHKWTWAFVCGTSCYNATLPGRVR